MVACPYDWYYIDLFFLKIVLFFYSHNLCALVKSDPLYCVDFFSIFLPMPVCYLKMFLSYSPSQLLLLLFLSI